MAIMDKREYDRTAPDKVSLWSELRGVSFRQGWLDAGGVKTRFLHAGDSNKPPLIFLHGVGGHAEAYTRNLGPHGEHFSTWSIDMVGHGWSGKPDCDLEIEQYVDHLVAFIDAIGAEKAFISGESLGGWVAARFAARHGERVEKLVLNTMGGTRANPKVMERLRTLSLQAADDPNWDFIQARIEWLMHDNADAIEDLISCRQSIYRQSGMQKVMQHVIVLQDLETRVRNLLKDEEFAQIDVPTMVLWTSHDPSGAVSEGQSIASKIAGSKFVVMEECGHWPQWEDAEVFNQIHLDFLLGRDGD